MKSALICIDFVCSTLALILGIIIIVVEWCRASDISATSIQSADIAWICQLPVPRFCELINWNLSTRARIKYILFTRNEIEWKSSQDLYPPTRDFTAFKSIELKRLNFAFHYLYDVHRCANDWMCAFPLNNFKVKCKHSCSLQSMICDCGVSATFDSAVDWKLAHSDGTGGISYVRWSTIWREWGHVPCNLV